MTEDLEFLDLKNIGASVAPELFVAELQKVLENIADINTNPKEKRVIVLKFEFTPSVDRDDALIVVTGSSKLAPYLSQSANV